MVLVFVWVYLILLVSVGYYLFRCSWYLPPLPKPLDGGPRQLGPSNGLNILNIFSLDGTINDLAMLNDIDARLMNSQLLWHICHVIPRLQFPVDHRTSRKLRFGLLALGRRIKDSKDNMTSPLLQGLDVRSVPGTAWRALTFMFAEELSHAKAEGSLDRWLKYMFNLTAWSIIPDADTPMSDNVNPSLLHILRNFDIDELLSISDDDKGMGEGVRAEGGYIGGNRAESPVQRSSSPFSAVDKETSTRTPSSAVPVKTAALKDKEGGEVKSAHTIIGIGTRLQAIEKVLRSARHGSFALGGFERSLHTRPVRMGGLGGESHQQGTTDEREDHAGEVTGSGTSILVNGAEGLESDHASSIEKRNLSVLPPVQDVNRPVKGKTDGAWRTTSAVFQNMSDVLKIIQPSKAWFIITRIFQHIHSEDLVISKNVFKHPEALRTAQLLVDLIVGLLVAQLQAGKRTDPWIPNGLDVLNKAIIAFPNTVCLSEDAAERDSARILMENLVMPSSILQFFNSLSIQSKVLCTRAGRYIFNPDLVVMKGECTFVGYESPR